MKLEILIAIITLAMVLIFTSGCLPSRGWEFKIGVSPVSRVDNKQGLDQEIVYRKSKLDNN